MQLPRILAGQQQAGWQILRLVKDVKSHTPYKKMQGPPPPATLVRSGAAAPPPTAVPQSVLAAAQPGTNEINTATAGACAGGTPASEGGDEPGSDRRRSSAQETLVQMGFVPEDVARALAVTPLELMCMYVCMYVCV